MRYIKKHENQDDTGTETTYKKERERDGSDKVTF